MEAFLNAVKTVNDAVNGALIIIGGLQRIARVAEIVVPFMAVAYVIGALIIFGINIDQVGPMFVSIFKFAFTPRPCWAAVSACSSKRP